MVKVDPLKGLCQRSRFEAKLVTLVVMLILWWILLLITKRERVTDVKFVFSCSNDCHALKDRYLLRVSYQGISTYWINLSLIRLPILNLVLSQVLNDILSLLFGVKVIKLLILGSREFSIELGFSFIKRALLLLPWIFLILRWALIFKICLHHMSHAGINLCSIFDYKLLLN